MPRSIASRAALLWICALLGAHGALGAQVSNSAGASVPSELAPPERSAGSRAADSAMRSIGASPLGSGTGPVGSVLEGAELSPDEEGYFDLFVEGLPGRTPIVTFVDSVGRVLVPLRTVLDHLGIPTVETAGTLVLEWPPERWRTVVDVAKGSIERGDTSMPFPVPEWAVRGDEVYVSAAVLAEALVADAEVRFADLLVVVAGNAAFPVIVNRARAARRDRDVAGTTLGPLDAFAGVPYVDRTGGVVGAWGLSVADASDATHGTFLATLGGSVLGGATEAGLTGSAGSAGGAVDGAAIRFQDLFVHHQRVFSGTPWARRLDVGSVRTEGTFARRVVGATLTNAPLVTPRYFGDAVIAPAVPAGWDYEVYQGEHLVGVSTAESPSRIQAPLGYGNTPVTVRMIGPAGQEVVQDLVYVVPAARVQPGTWRYTVGGGACRDGDCDQYYYGEVGRGLTPWLTTGLGGDWLSDADGSRFVPFAKVGVAPRPDVSVEMQARAASFLRMGLQWVAGPSGTLSGSYTWNGAEAGLGAAGWVGQLDATGAVPALGNRWLGARLLVRGARRDRIDAWQGALSTTVDRTHLSLELESGLQDRTIGTMRLFHTMASRLPPILTDASWTAALGVGGRGIERAELGASVRTTSRAQIDARVRFQEGTSPMLSLGASLRSGFGFFQARTTRGSATGAFMAADGGFSYERGSGVHAQSSAAVGRGGVRGRVFRDLDGDGLRGPDEPIVEGAAVLVDGRRAATDEAGRYHAWGVTPFEGIAVSVDPLTLAPGWAPSSSATLLRASPNMYTPVDLPVHRTRELFGSVVREGEVPTGVGGLLVEVVAEDGSVVAEARTYSDGVFYVERIRPGSYGLRLGGSIGRWRVYGEVLDCGFVVPDEDGDAVSLPPLMVARPSTD